MKILKIMLFIVLNATIIYSCGDNKASSSNSTGSEKAKKKTADQELGDKLIGTYFNDDDASFKDLSIEYYKDGKFEMKWNSTDYQDMAMGSSNETDYQLVTINFNAFGTWKIENGFMKKVFEKVTSDSGYDKEYYKSILKEMNKKNTADKIIEINEQKFVFDDAEGERKTWKRKVQ
jgi:hypothetical protein